MKVLIVDDEPLARSRLARLLGRLDDVHVVGEACDGEEALERARELQPDVMLLDIDMPGLDGIAVSEHPDAPPIVFTTAHAKFALDAFEADAYDYLLKPIGEARLRRALDKVSERAHSAADPSEPWRLVVTDGSLRTFVDAREVMCFTAEQKYVVFRLDGKEHLLRESLDRLEARLAPLGFLRPHRRALVRRDAIVAFDSSDGGSLVLEDDTRLPVSRRAMGAMRAALGIGRAPGTIETS